MTQYATQTPPPGASGPSEAPAPAAERGIGELLSDLTHEIITLVRQEINLAKTEMTQKVTNIGKQVGLLVAGAVVANAGVLIVLAALALLLNEVAHLPLWVSFLIVGALVLAVGGALAVKGLNALKHEDLTPRQTIQSIKELKNG